MRVLREDDGPPTPPRHAMGAASISAPAGDAMVVLNRQPAPHPARRDDLDRLAVYTMVVARIAGRVPVRCGTLPSPSLIRTPDRGLVLAVPSGRLPEIVEDTRPSSVGSVSDGLRSPSRVRVSETDPRRPHLRAQRRRRDDADAAVRRLPPGSGMLTDRCVRTGGIELTAVAVAQPFGVRHIRHSGGAPCPSENCSVTSKPWRRRARGCGA